MCHVMLSSVTHTHAHARTFTRVRIEREREREREREGERPIKMFYGKLLLVLSFKSRCGIF